jgi:hypothetical protein
MFIIYRRLRPATRLALLESLPRGESAVPGLRNTLQGNA